MQFFTGTPEEQLAQLQRIPTTGPNRILDAYVVQRAVDAYNAGNLGNSRGGFGYLLKKIDQNLSRGGTGFLTEHISNEMSNLANIGATPEGKASELYRQKAATIDEWIQQLRRYQEIFPQANIQLPASPVQNASGNFQPAGERLVGGVQGGSQQRAQQAAFVRQQPDGTWAITDRAGTVFEGGFANEQTALARQDEYVTRGGSGSRLDDQDLAQDNAPALPPDLEVLADQIADQVSGSDLVYNPTVTAEDIDNFVVEGLAQAKTEFDPYYGEIIGRATEAYKAGLEYEATQRRMELEQQAIERRRAIEAQQASLEERGMTFSGEAVEQLGAESALGSEDVRDEEGNIPRSARLVASSSEARFAERARQIGTAAEEYLGTDRVTAIGSPIVNGRPMFTPSGTPSAGAVNRDRTTAERQRASELARGSALRRLATSQDFPVSDLLSLI